MGREPIYQSFVHLFPPSPQIFTDKTSISVRWKHSALSADVWWCGVAYFLVGWLICTVKTHLTARLCKAQVAPAEPAPPYSLKLFFSSHKSTFYLFMYYFYQLWLHLTFNVSADLVVADVFIAPAAEWIAPQGQIKVQKWIELKSTLKHKKLVFDWLHQFEDDADTLC